MKSYILFCGAFLLSIYTLGAHAAEVPEELQVTQVSDTSISIDWADVTDTIGYYVYYGTKSGSGSQYETEVIDILEESEFVIDDLTKETTYFLAVTSMDNEGVESEYSSELEYTTLEEGQTKLVTSFRIKDVELIDKTTLEFIFSTDLDTNEQASRVFVIEDKLTGEEVSIDISEVSNADNKNVLVLLGSSLEASTVYKVTVLDISDAKGNTIESGIDAFIEFTTPSVFSEDIVVETPIEETPLPEEETSTVDESTQEDLSAAGTESATESDAGNAGVTISQEDMSNNTSQAASDNEKLPQTGPEHWLLLILSILIAAGIYIIHNRRIIFKK